MGLDQNAYYKIPSKDGFHDVGHLMYWRKHNRLQGYMENLWKSKGSPINPSEEIDNEDLVFSGIELQLTSHDIEKLEHAILEYMLPEASGFFWGDDSYKFDADGEFHDEIQKNYYHFSNDLEFIKLAKGPLSKGQEVYYCPDW